METSRSEQSLMSNMTTRVTKTPTPPRGSPPSVTLANENAQTTP